MEPTGGSTALWSLSAEQALARLESTDRGLRTGQADERLRQFGANQITEKARLHLLADFARRLGNPLVLILLIAAAASGLTGDRTSFGIILLMVLLSTGLDTVQERRAENMAEALKRSIAITARVWRDGQLVHLPVAMLVPGDVVALAAGDLVPADGLVLEANAAQVNQAILTGEPFPVEKRAGPAEGATLLEASNVMLHGSAVVGGAATILVIATGSATEFGKIAASLQKRDQPTAFERGLHRLGILIARLTALLVLFVLLSHLALGRPPLESFLFAVALAVGLTPELLPMIVTIALARGAVWMASAKVVVKRLSAIHDLGQADVLCTDKTGTLTQARIALVGHPGIDGADSERVLRLAVLNARYETGIKSPLDEALIAHGSDLALDDWTKLDERPFDFERRRVSVLCRQGDQRIEVVKGAPETVLALCERAERADGSVAVLDPETRARLAALHDQHAQQGLRLLGVAWKDAGNRDRIGRDDDAGLTFAGFCTFVDPPKPGAAEAIAHLEGKGMAVKLLSGDSPLVCRHLLTELGVPITGELCGDAIAHLSDDALAARVDAVNLFARITPEQKSRIVHALQRRGHTVAFLGDGINDAPAIRLADVGLSVDDATDVAREAADMILLNPDLGVLADGVEEGRRTYANIIKYIRMGTSSNFGNMLTMALASVVLPFLPLTAVQVLINNLLYDLSQVGIPFDSADAADTARPHGWDMAALVRFTLFMGPLSSLFDIATFAALTLVFHVDQATFRTAWFMESMATQILVVFVIRTAAHSWQSRPHRMLLASILPCFAAAMVLPFLPLAPLIGFVPLGLAMLVPLALLVLAYLACAELIKPLALRTLRD